MRRQPRNPWNPPEPHRRSCAGYRSTQHTARSKPHDPGCQIRLWSISVSANKLRPWKHEYRSSPTKSKGGQTSRFAGTEGRYCDKPMSERQSENVCRRPKYWSRNQRKLCDPRPRVGRPSTSMTELSRASCDHVRRALTHHPRIAGELSRLTRDGKPVIYSGRGH